LHRAQNTISILARNQVGKHRVYSGHYPRIFVAPKNAQNPETKCQAGAVPILLLVIPASTTSAYSSLNFLQELNPQPQLLKALVYHSATSAVCNEDEMERQGELLASLNLSCPNNAEQQNAYSNEMNSIDEFRNIDRDLLTSH
jgi:hypothetical protein